MKINIFGVGRSGSKAVQLYAAYYLAKKFGKVQVNFEPFLFRTRKQGDLSKKGAKLNKEVPFFLGEKDSLSRAFVNYMAQLTSDKAVVTKFIRGNGRINPINKIMKPDLAVVIVRNLYETLASIAVEEWGLETEWDLLYREIRDKFPKLKRYLVPQDKMTKHAVLWYTMNAFALKNAQGVYFIHYSELNKIKFLLKKMGLAPDLDISHPRFLGRNIHEDPYPLKDIASKREPNKIGSLCEIAPGEAEQKYVWNRAGDPKAIIKPFPLFEKMQSKIDSLFEKAQEKQGEAENFIGYWKKAEKRA